MTVFGSGGGGGFLAGKQVFPLDYEAEVSQRLLDALNSNDLKSASECIDDPLLDVNFVGAVCLKVRKSEVVLRDELPIEVRVKYEDFRTDVTAFFLAVHIGNVALVRKLLSIGADVNQKLFRGYATTAAVRNGHRDILEILLKAGASQPACEEALLEASCHGRAKFVELLMGSDQIRSHVIVHAFVTACCKGFIDVVDVLLKCETDVDAITRVLLQSSKPSLHINVDSTGLVAAVVSRQVSVVELLLQAGARTDIRVRLGAWSWDTSSGEEIRVGAGLAEPYAITWCAVEYFEKSGVILRMLLQHHSPNSPHLGRTLLHHAILCGNIGAVKVLLAGGADPEFPVQVTQSNEFRSIHMAARRGSPTIIKCLVDAGCDVNSRTGSGDTALMLSVKYKQEECLKTLAKAGADFSLVNDAGFSVVQMARVNKWSLGFQKAVLHVIKEGKIPKSSNLSVFSPLMFAAQLGDTEALEFLISKSAIDINHQDENGFTAVMATAVEGNIEAFRLLVYAGADVKLCCKSGENVMSLSELNQKRDLFEKVMIEFALEIGNRNAGGFYALHCAARRGDLDAVKSLTGNGYDVNTPDSDGYTPLMLAAREGHADICHYLISEGADCRIMSFKRETALSLARKNGIKKNDTEIVILDSLAKELVLSGAYVQKYTKGGKGRPHGKIIKMLGTLGVLQWGKSRKRNVICKEAEVGPSMRFRKNRKGGAIEPGLFRVVTSKNKEVHFVCDGGIEAAELWVRGIKLVTAREASCRTK